MTVLLQSNSLYLGYFFYETDLFFSVIMTAPSIIFKETDSDEF